jgi:hypothetical protein
MLVKLIAWFRFRREIRNINQRAAKVAKLTLANKALIEAQQALIQNLQKEVAAALLDRNSQNVKIADLERQFMALRSNIAAAGPAKLETIRTTSWRQFKKEIGQEDFNVPA